MANGKGYRLLALVFMTICAASVGFCAGDEDTSPSPAEQTTYVEIEDRLNLWTMPNVSELPNEDGGTVVLGQQERIRNENGKFVMEWSNQRESREGYDQPVEWSPRYALQPSAETPGDLDLVAVYSRDSGSNGEKPHPLSRPVPSYFHQMQDPRVEEYFEISKGLRYSESNLTRPTTVILALRKLATGMATDAPNDLFSRFFLMDALAQSGDIQGLTKEIDLWTRDHADTLARMPVLRAALKRFEATRRALGLSSDGKNGHDFIDALGGQRISKTDLATGCGTFPQVLNYEEYARPWLPSGPQDDFRWVQINAKNFATAVPMFLLQGNRAAARGLATALYHSGQLMSQNGTSLNRRTGSAIREIAAERLGIVALNACETPKEAVAMWESLEWLNEREKPLTPRDLVALEPLSTYVDEKEWFTHKILGPSIILGITESKAADAQFQLVRMATAAWHCRLVTGALPTSAEEFALSDGSIPRDPFVEDRLSFIQTPSSLICYSLGPNRKDEGGTDIYDPTNGTASAGDIILEVPQQRRYPFPWEGVKAATRGDFLARFPDGLPVDLYSDTRRSLGITDTPVVIYSFGPDANERDAKKLENNTKQPKNQKKPKQRKKRPEYRPDTLYDPTNGMISRGDLTYVVPVP